MAVRRVLTVLALIVGLVAYPAVAFSVPARTSAGVGDTITLHGLDDGEALAVTLTNVVDPASPADDFSGPASGNRLVATQFRLANVGSVEFTDATIRYCRGPSGHVGFTRISAVQRRPGVIDRICGRCSSRCRRSSFARRARARATRRAMRHVRQPGRASREVGSAGRHRSVTSSSRCPRCPPRQGAIRSGLPDSGVQRRDTGEWRTAASVRPRSCEPRGRAGLLRRDQRRRLPPRLGSGRPEPRRLLPLFRRRFRGHEPRHRDDQLDPRQCRRGGSRRRTDGRIAPRSRLFIYRTILPRTIFL